MGSNFKQIAFCLVAAAGGLALAITMMSGSEHEGSKNQVAKVAVLPADSNKAASTVSVAVNADGASEQAVDFDKVKERLGVDYDPMIFRSCTDGGVACYPDHAQKDRANSGRSGGK